MSSSTAAASVQSLNPQFSADKSKAPSTPKSVELTQGSTSHSTSHTVTPLHTTPAAMAKFVDPNVQKNTTPLSAGISQLTVTTTPKLSVDQVWISYIELLDNAVTDPRVRRLLISGLTGYFSGCFEQQLDGELQLSTATQAIGNAIHTALKQTTVKAATKPLIAMLMATCKFDKIAAKVYLIDCLESILRNSNANIDPTLQAKLSGLQSQLLGVIGSDTRIPITHNVLPPELQIDLLAPHAEVIFAKLQSEGLCTVSATRCDMATKVFDALLGKNEKKLLPEKLIKFKPHYEKQIGAKDGDGKLLEWGESGQMDYFLGYMSQLVHIKHKDDTCVYPADAMVLQLFLQEPASKDLSRVAQDTSIRNQLIDICRKSIKDIPDSQLGSFTFALLSIATFDLFGDIDSKHP